MTPTLYLAYFLATLALCLTPGPAVFLVSAQAASRGFGAGVLAVTGIVATEVIYWTVSVAGLAAVLANSEIAFTIIKYAGAAYLIVLGVLGIKNARKNAESTIAGAPAKLWRSPFLQGFVGQLANPKSILFFVAFLPQFMTPGKTTPFDIAMLAIIAMGLDFIVLNGYGWLAARSGSLMRDAGRIIWRERIAGAVLVVVGGAIAFMRRA